MSNNEQYQFQIIFIVDRILERLIQSSKQPLKKDWTVLSETLPSSLFIHQNTIITKN